MCVQGRWETYTKKLYGNEHNFQKNKTKNKMVLKRTLEFLVLYFWKLRSKNYFHLWVSSLSYLRLKLWKKISLQQKENQMSLHKRSLNQERRERNQILFLINSCSLKKKTKNKRTKKEKENQCARTRRCTSEKQKEGNLIYINESIIHKIEP